MEVKMLKTQKLTKDELRNKLLYLIKDEGIPVTRMARDMDVSFITLDDFLKGKKNPIYATICKMREYLENHGK